ncbi:hypothetical protein HCN44_010971 [Aphidius gifuensis]|uniref:BEN domain-containing protein n=1 Tax=Aphidius gifuensis TaxID=684658 RepID=A0A834Y3B7_APHGI|nr:hypothetical protein HCN44_010971 [Aphidius gifuensis]
MTKNIENQSCILIQFTEESNEEFVGLEEWIQDENLEEFFFDNLEKEPKIIKTSNVTMVNAEHDPQLSCLTPITSIENLSTQTKTSTIQPASFLSEPTLENTPENIQQTQWTDSTTISHLNSSTQFKNLNFGSKKFLSKPTSNVTMVNAEHPQSSCSTPITNIENLSTQTTTLTIQPASILSEPTLENTPANIQQTQWTDSTTISHLNSSTQFKNLNFGSKKFLSKPTSNVTMVNAEHPQSSCSTPITNIENLSTQTTTLTIQPASILSEPTLENTPANIQQTQWTDSTTISHLNSSTQFKNLNFGSKKFLSKPTSNVTMVNAEHPQSSCSTPITSIENLSTQTKNSSIQPALFLPKPNERDENRPFSHEVDGIQVGDNIDRSNPRVWTHLHGAVYIKQAKLRRLCLDGKAEKRNLAGSVSRQLMNMLVPRDVLAVHSLSGKSSPAFPDKPLLPRIDSRITEAIFQYIKKEIMPNAVRADCNAGITGICADAAKTCRRRRNRNAN